MDKNILRVSTYPTVEKPGMGLHPSKLCEIDSFYTYYLTPIEESDRLFVTKNTELIEKPFLLEVRPKSSSLYKRIFFSFKRIISIFSFSLQGLQILLFKKVDIVHIHSPMYILIAFFGWLLQKNIYITFHGTDFHRIKNARWYKLFANVFDKVFIISPDMKDILSQIHGSNKVVLVQNGIDLDIYKNLNCSRKRQIIAVGSLKDEKGFYYLIEAFSKMIKEYKELNNYTLKIAGEGLLKKQLEEQIKLNDMQNQIFLIGHKNREEIIKLYNESEIFVLSSISEGFPKVILEAMSCGCKIVSTNVGSVPFVLKNTHFEIVDKKDIIKLKKAILNTIDQDNILYNKILEYFTWNSVRKIYENEYERE